VGVRLGAYAAIVVTYCPGKPSVGCQWARVRLGGDSWDTTYVALVIGAVEVLAIPAGREGYLGRRRRQLVDGRPGVWMEVVCWRHMWLIALWVISDEL
jgi:hypothetical protein